MFSGLSAAVGLVAAAALLGFFLPLIISAVRNAEETGLVAFLTVLTPVTGGVTWFIAFWVAVTSPRKSMAVRGRPVRRAARRYC